MANPTKKAGKPLAIRVAADSALARLTEGKPFTETVHRMAELFEQMLAADAALPAADTKDAETRAQHTAEEARAQVFTVTEPDGFTRVERTAQEVLELAREQYPAGLVPVGLDDDDAGFEAGGLTPSEEDEDEDLSYLA